MGATLHRGARASLSRPLLLRSTGSRRAGSVVVGRGPSCSVACGIFPDQGSNPCPLHWQADSQPLRHQGSPLYSFLSNGFYHSMDVYNFLVRLNLPPTLSFFFFFKYISLCQSMRGCQMRGWLLCFFRTYVDDHRVPIPLRFFDYGWIILIGFP